MTGVINTLALLHKEKAMFQERLKKLRKSKNMSQQDLADELGISQQTVAKWESGTASPKNTAIVRLSSIFDVSCDYLLGNQKKISEKEAIEMLFGDDFEYNEETINDVQKYIEFLKQRNN